MPTVRDLISDSHKVIGVLGTGGTLGDALADTGLTFFRRMLDTANAKRLCIGTVSRLTVTWTANQGSRTIAASGANLAAQRPEWLDRWGVIPSGETDEAIIKRPLTRQEYQEIPDKAATAAYFSELSYEPTYPYGTITVYPVPTTAPTLVLYTPTAITAGSSVTLNTDLSYAPGYEEFFLYALAKRLAPIFSRPWTATLQQLEMDAVRTVAAKNVRVEQRRNDPALVGSGGSFDIESGRFR